MRGLIANAIANNVAHEMQQGLSLETAKSVVRFRMGTLKFTQADWDFARVCFDAMGEAEPMQVVAQALEEHEVTPGAFGNWQRFLNDLLQR
jgi:hypothetical protein